MVIIFYKIDENDQRRVEAEDRLENKIEILKLLRGNGENIR